MKNLAACLTWIVVALTTATAVQALDTVWVVRHADKVDGWEAADELHPLSCQGLTRAERLAEKLGELALSLFGPEHGVELEVPERTPHDPPDLGS